MMWNVLEKVVMVTGIFYLLYLFFYATYLFSSVIAGMWRMYGQKKQKERLENAKPGKERLENVNSEKRRIENTKPGKEKSESNILPENESCLPVSILIPAYNEEVTIVDSIRSLLRLQYEEYEIIVIDDGSIDHTKDRVVQAFSMTQVQSSPENVENVEIVMNSETVRSAETAPDARTHLVTMPVRQRYETTIGRVKLTLIIKENGGKGDSLNAGMNVSNYPYFLCMDADSVLSKDALSQLTKAVTKQEHVIGVGGMVCATQCMKREENGRICYRMPRSLIVAMQAVEYDRSFLASRILFNCFNANLIISGAFGLFEKETVVAAGGYDSDTLGEDMSLVLKLHVFCRNQKRPYRMCYEPDACCYSQVPSTMKDLQKQRQRWYIGLFQSMCRYRTMFANARFGVLSVFSYMYYLFYELLAPFFEVFGIAMMVLAWHIGMLNVPFMAVFLLLYIMYGTILTVTVFSERVYTSNCQVCLKDTGRVLLVCLLENVFFRYVLSFVRLLSFWGYQKKKQDWGRIKREKY